MALARPRGELGHIRLKLPSNMAPPRPLLERPHGPRICVMALVRPRPSTWCSRQSMTHKRKSMAAKGKGNLATPPTRKSPRLAGLPPSLPPTSPKSMLRLNKLLVLAIAVDAVRIHSKARESPQAPVVEPPKDVKGKRTARISAKPLQKPRPTKIKVIDLVSDEEKEAAKEKKDSELEDEEEEEDPEEASASLTLPSPPKRPSGAYDDPHYWDYDGDLD
ncbi:hypothetical protein PIB30_076693 [Stylosanthes scabra]|uniref:Uncharacterized protein n=1 Tax=Stylosanthes scabra TaxID=79078 RepID=A0ABU6XNA6_9FABA|nr:hypothetical protein [Stylosanthes scabra]